MRGPEGKAFPVELPLLALPGKVVFPFARANLEITAAPQIDLADAALANNRLLAMLPLGEDERGALSRLDLPRRASVVRIARMNRLNDGAIRLVVQGIARVEVNEILRQEPFPVAHLQRIEEVEGHELRVEALRRNSLRLLRKVTSDEGLLLTAEGTADGARFADLVAAGLPLSFGEKLALLREDDIEKRMEETGRILERESKLRNLEEDIKRKVNSELGREEREKYLRRQIASIREELGEEDERTSQVRELRRRLTEAQLPDAAMERAREEITRLARTPVQSGEFVVSRNHIDWILSLPWQDRSGTSIDLDEARRILDRNHYGLEKIKERIVEFLAIRKLKEDARSPFLCFIGPPGVGKTSMGLAIAEALGRRVAHVSLGGVTDDGEIRGHRMTYTGALPGRILQELRRVGVRNPVFMLDEIDKVGSEYRGDPAASLLEVLDPDQNRIFFDHYLNLPFDLSEVFFITTANSMDAIPPGLLDRMELVRFPGYTSTEKIAITRRHLLPRQLSEHGLPQSALRFKVDAIRKILSEYAIEAGLRDLDRSIATICRKRAVRWLDGDREKYSISRDEIPEYLGNPVYYPELKRGASEIGIATTLAWTPTGGEILFIEALLMPGGRSLQLTGHLGEVMRESAETALSFVRHFIETIGAPRELIDESDIHLHVPAGAIPKDGPSAGVGLATALFSMLSGRPVRNDMAMTGEITLRGVVLPVAGLKEKIFGAHRAGIREVILPAKNAPELSEIPDEILKTMKFHAVDRVEQVFQIACLDAPERKADVGLIELFLKYQQAKKGLQASEPIAFHDLLSNPKRVVVCLSDDTRIPPLVLPALRLLRDIHPDIRILLVSGDANVETLRRERIADKAMVLNRRKGTKQVAEVRNLAREIEPLDPNILLLLDPSGDPALKALAYACKAPLRAGFGTGENYPFLNFQVAPPKEGTYIADALLKIIGSMTGQFVDFLDDRVRLRVPEADARKAERLLHFWKPRSDKLLFAIQPGGEGEGRRVDMEKHATVARLLARAYDARIMIVAPPDERDYAEELEQKLAAIEPYRAPVEDFSQTVAFLSRADLLVSANTPLFHYAVAIGVPVVGLFREDCEAWWTPPDGVRATTLPIRKEITEEQFLNAVDLVGSGSDDS